MKKAIIVVAVLALTMVSSVALAEVTVSGSIDYRGRAVNNIDNIASYPDPDVSSAATVNGRDNDRFDEFRVSLTVDGKMGDAKGKLTIWTDWEKLGGLENSNGAYVAPAAGAAQTNGVMIKEAWADFPLFGAARAKFGHMPLMLGNGWYFRNMYRGDDAIVLYADAGGHHFGLVDIKISEVAQDLDSDIFAAVWTMKSGDSVFGVNLSRAVFAKPNAGAGSHTLNDLGAHATIAAGAAKLNIQADIQMGKDKTKWIVPDGGLGANPEYKGNQIVVTGSVPMGPANFLFTVGRGSGNKTTDANGSATSTDYDQFQVWHDITPKPNYTFFYDYLLKTAASRTIPAAGNWNSSTISSGGLAGNGKNQGFANTTAVGVGGDLKAGIATYYAGFWYLQATEKTNLNGATDALGNLIYSSDVGMELDASAAFKLADTVTATLYGAYFMPGEAYKYNKVIADGAGNGVTTATDPDEGTALFLVITAGLK